MKSARYNHWDKVKSQALKLYDSIPLNPYEMDEDDFFSKLTKNNLSSHHLSWELDSFKIETPNEEEKKRFMKALICSFKREYRDNENPDYRNFIVSNNEEGTDFLFVSTRIFSNLEISNIYSVRYEGIDRKNSNLSIRYSTFHNGSRLKKFSAPIKFVTAFIFPVIYSYSIINTSGGVNPSTLGATVFFIYSGRALLYQMSRLPNEAL